MEPRKVFLETPVIFVPRRDSRERAPHGKRLGRMHEQGRHVWNRVCFVPRLRNSNSSRRARCPSLGGPTSGRVPPFNSQSPLPKFEHLPSRGVLFQLPLWAEGLVS